MIDETVKTDILSALLHQHAAQHVTVLYACESGSRAWGFPSPDSDYDVRFIYCHDPDWYLSLYEERDVIEQPINDLLDISGWDLRKAMGLLSKSNGPLLEWLHSPIVYQQVDNVTITLRELARKSYRPGNGVYHYLGMAKRGWANLAGVGQIKLKRYFYVLRALLCCEWIISEKTIPPVEFPVILARFYPKGDFRGAVDELMQLKSRSNETDILEREQYKTLFSVVDRRIGDLLVFIKNNFPENKPSFDKAEFNEAFRHIIRTTR
ncbi:MAG: nucleotidyltransferase domain-containing protein [Gammaproteobacteria bacterium]|nr:nucleotidyltransferase domain-containing protein [Gammaproteobacteria bacterium]MDH5652007.1 nucleotidyltransferase domain-containing protein [Gammaproteobacteria bacterium]